MGASGRHRAAMRPRFHQIITKITAGSDATTVLLKSAARNRTSDSAYQRQSCAAARRGVGAGLGAIERLEAEVAQ